MDTHTLYLADALQGISTALRAVFLVTMPDCLAYDHWMRSGDPLESVDVSILSAQMGYLTKANKEALREMRSQGGEMVLTVETPDLLLLMKEVSADFVAAFVFEAKAPLGMARMHMKQALDRIKVLVPDFKPEERPRVFRLIEYYQHASMDPHTAMPRLALQSRVAPGQLEAPESLTPEQIETVERSIARLLGVPYPLSV